MSTRIFTESEIKELCANENVLRCSSKSITFKEEFKIKTIRQYQQGMTPQQIFIEANLNLNTIGRQTPKFCLVRWRKVYKKKGCGGFKESRGFNRKGRLKKPIDLSPQDKIKRLEAEVIYLKAENDFLTRRRAKRNAKR